MPRIGKIASSLINSGTSRTARSVMGRPGRPVRRGIHMANQAMMGAASGVSRARPAVSKVSAAMKGKHASRYVAGGAVGAAVIGGVARRSGPAADRPRGRPTGMYGF